MSNPLAGIEGGVSFDGTNVLHVKKWSADITTEALESTSWDWALRENIDKGWKDFVPGLSAWSASLECLADDALVPEEGALGTLTLKARNGVVYSGLAFVTKVGQQFGIESLATVTIDLQGIMKPSAPGE